MPPFPIQIHIRGCRIGEDVKYMNRLQDVLGDKVAVTAPRHLAGVQALIAGKRHVVDPPSHGYLECLMYSFEVKAKAAITDRAVLVKAFKDAKLKFIDGFQVPDALWDQWVPKTTFNRPSSPIVMPPLSLNAVLQSTDPTVTLPNVRSTHSNGEFEHYDLQRKRERARACFRRGPGEAGGLQWLQGFLAPWIANRRAE